MLLRRTYFHHESWFRTEQSMKEFYSVMQENRRIHFANSPIYNTDVKLVTWPELALKQYWWVSSIDGLSMHINAPRIATHSNNIQTNVLLLYSIMENHNILSAFCFLPKSNVIATVRWGLNCWLVWQDDKLRHFFCAALWVYGMSFQETKKSGVECIFQETYSPEPINSVL